MPVGAEGSVQCNTFGGQGRVHSDPGAGSRTLFHRGPTVFPVFEVSLLLLLLPPSLDFSENSCVLIFLLFCVTHLLVVFITAFTAITGQWACVSY